MQSDTPRTDAASWIGASGDREVRADFAQKLERELAAAKADLAAMREQRDEARREWCYMESCVRNEYGMEPTDQPSIAAERGWDCYEQQEGGGA